MVNRLTFHGNIFTGNHRLSHEYGIFLSIVPKKTNQLVGGFTPSDKYESPLGWFSLWKNQIHVPNHQIWYACCFRPMYLFYLLCLLYWIVLDYWCYHLVGGWTLPLWQIWVRQLGLWFPIYGKKNNMFQTTNQSLYVLEDKVGGFQNTSGGVVKLLPTRILPCLESTIN